MLSSLKIENVAVIEKAQARFTPGLNVLTGETGAGKSILIDSINAILGNRTSRDLVRTGAAKACVWATFTGVSPQVQARLEQAGYEAGEDLLLYRILALAQLLAQQGHPLPEQQCAEPVLLRQLQNRHRSPSSPQIRWWGA